MIKMIRVKLLVLLGVVLSALFVVMPFDVAYAQEQSRVVECQDQDGNVVADSLCTDPKPDEVQACLLHNWVQTGWGICTVGCGGGTQNAIYVCQDAGGNAVANSNCSGPAPTGSQPCNMQACATGNECGASIRHQPNASTEWNDFTCPSNSKLWVGSPSNFVTGGSYTTTNFGCTVHSDCTGPSSPPPPAVTYAWDTSDPWGTCTDLGTYQWQQIGNSFCAAQYFNSEDPRDCAATNTGFAGNNTPCSSRYDGDTCNHGGWAGGGDYGTSGCMSNQARQREYRCNLVSGPSGAEQTRSVVCRGSDGNVYPDGNCPSPKPDTSQSCTLPPGGGLPPLPGG